MTTLAQARKALNDAQMLNRRWKFAFLPVSIGEDRVWLRRYQSRIVEFESYANGLYSGTADLRLDESSPPLRYDFSGGCYN